MTNPTATSWHAVAETKLSRVLGAEEGARILREVLAEIKTANIDSPAALRRFATALAARGGFNTAIAAMLDVHATMYGKAAGE